MIFIDFETQSEVDIKTSGVYKYVQGAYFQPVCMSWAIDDADVFTWVPGKPFPFDKEIVTGNNLLAAYNIEFEYNVLKSKWFKWNGIDMSWLKIDHFIDVQALGRIFGFPASLDKLAKALNVRHKKDARGTRLINKLCVIKNGKVPTPETYKSDFLDLYEYCEQDIRTTRACYNKLPKKQLSKFERVVFRHMIKQNERGLPIDLSSTILIQDKVQEFINYKNQELSKLTNNIITKGSQTQRIKFYLGIDNVQAQTVQDLLDNPNFPSDKKEILKIRQLTSKSSTAKFKKLIKKIELDNRIRGNLKYYGGHTGRFAGVEFQLHNLPRSKFESPEEIIDDFKSMSVQDLEEKYGNVSEAASKLIRPMIKAPKGKKLIVADYVSIENVLLHWVAGDMKTTKEFSQGLDQYKTYAAKRFNVKYDEVTEEQRNYSKPIVLGLGYGGGEAALQRVAEGYGIILSDEAAKNDKRFYRNSFPMIPELWYRAQDCMIRAVERETIVDLSTKTTSFKFIKRGNYAFILLPSDRFLCYPLPTIQLDPFYGRKCFSYVGEDPYTKKWRRLGDQTVEDIFGNPNPDMPIHGGRLVENIIQALARDLLVYGGLQAEKKGFKLIGSVHDEWICEANESVTGNSLDEFCKTICILPEWAEGLPLRSEGYISRRYRKE